MRVFKRSKMSFFTGGSHVIRISFSIRCAVSNIRGEIKLSRSRYAPMYAEARRGYVNNKIMAKRLKAALS